VIAPLIDEGSGDPGLETSLFPPGTSEGKRHELVAHDVWDEALKKV
jgi:hypothetical protein